MSYCVNCGVELEKSMQFCPLCGTEVLNPREPFDSTLPKPYSSHLERAQVDTARRYTAWIVTVVMVLAAVVCVMADLVYSNRLTWSVYVVSSLMLAFVIVMLPLLYPGLNPAAAVLLDVCALLLFLYLMNMADRSGDWYYTLAMPQVLIVGVLALIDVVAFRSRHIHGLQRYGIISMSIGVSMVGLEVLLDLYNDMRLELTWSWFVIIPMFALGLILFLIERKREVKDELIRRMRV